MSSSRDGRTRGYHEADYADPHQRLLPNSPAELLRGVSEDQQFVAGSGLPPSGPAVRTTFGDGPDTGRNTLMMPGGMFGGPWAGGGFGIFGMIFMLVFWVLIIAGIVLVVRWLFEQGRSGGAPSSSGESALDILKKRYARGEIGKEEFDAKKKDLL